MNINDMENSVVTDPYLATVGTEFKRWSVLHLFASVNKLQASCMPIRHSLQVCVFFEPLDRNTEATFCSLKSII